MVPVGNTAKRLSSVNHTIKAIHHHHHHHHHIQKLLQVLNFTVATTQFTQKCNITNITKSGFLIHLKRILHFFKNTNYKINIFTYRKNYNFCGVFFTLLSSFFTYSTMFLSQQSFAKYSILSILFSYTVLFSVQNVRKKSLK